MKKIKLIPVLLAASAVTLLSCVYPTTNGDSFDLEERQSVWQYLKVYSIYQDRVPETGWELTPEEMFGHIDDLLHGMRFTSYLPGYQPPSGDFHYEVPDEEEEEVEAECKIDGVPVDCPVALSESTLLIKISSFSVGNLLFFKHFIPLMQQYPNIIIDLRNNGGGLIYVANEIVGEFLQTETQYLDVHRRVYNSASRRGYTVSPGLRTMTSNERIMIGSDPIPALTDKNVAILMNRWSASASEMVACALKDHAGALLAGQQSFGKGIGQSILTRTGRSTLRITSMYFSGMEGGPTGDYHINGIPPDPVSDECMELAEKIIAEDPEADATSIDAVYAALMLEGSVCAYSEVNDAPRSERTAEGSRRKARFTGLSRITASPPTPIGAYDLSEPDPLL